MVNQLLIAMDTLGIAISELANIQKNEPQNCLIHQQTRVLPAFWLTRLAQVYTEWSYDSSIHLGCTGFRK